jgi:hypothetical protein
MLKNPLCRPYIFVYPSTHTSISFDITRDSFALMMANKTNDGGTGVLTGITTTNIQLSIALV